jgi:hypothetical protein
VWGFIEELIEAELEQVLLMAPRCCLPVPRERDLRAAITPM